MTKPKPTKPAAPLATPPRSSAPPPSSPPAVVTSDGKPALVPRPPVPPGTCFVCMVPRRVMLTLQMPEGERQVCSPCWRAQYNCR